MKTITIQVIDHKDQRLGQPGDWYFVNDKGEITDEGEHLVVKVSDLGDWRYNFLLGRHEMDEAMLCKFRGITVKQVDDYDARPAADEDDPDSFSGYPGAIYQQDHNDALAAEWVMARALKVRWEAYGIAFGPYWDDRNEDPRSPRNEAK